MNSRTYHIGSLLITVISQFSKLITASKSQKNTLVKTYVTNNSDTVLKYSIQVCIPVKGRVWYKTKNRIWFIFVFTQNHIKIKWRRNKLPATYYIIIRELSQFHFNVPSMTIGFIYASRGGGSSLFTHNLTSIFSTIINVFALSVLMVKWEFYYNIKSFSSNFLFQLNHNLIKLLLHHQDLTVSVCGEFQT